MPYITATGPHASRMKRAVIEADVLHDGVVIADPSTLTALWEARLVEEAPAGWLLTDRGRAAAAQEASYLRRLVVDMFLSVASVEETAEAFNLDPGVIAAWGVAATAGRAA